MTIRVVSRIVTLCRDVTQTRQHKKANKHMDTVRHVAISLLMTSIGVAVIFHIAPLRSLFTGIQVGTGGTAPAGTTGALYM